MMKVQQYNINTKAVGGKSIIEINLSSSVYRVSYIYIYICIITSTNKLIIYFTRVLLERT